MHKLENAESLIEKYQNQSKNSGRQVLPLRIDKEDLEALEKIAKESPLVENRSVLARNLLKFSLDEIRGEYDVRD